MQRHKCVLALLVCWQACHAAAAAAAAAPEAGSLLPSKTVNVSTGMELWAALADESIGEVQLLEDVALDQITYTPNQPLLRKNSLLIHSICGLQCDPAQFKVVVSGGNDVLACVIHTPHCRQSMHRPGLCCLLTCHAKLHVML